MTILSDEVKNGFNEILKYGEQVRFKYYTQSLGAGSYYDDDVSLTQSGTDFWVSGVVQPISNKQFSSDALLLNEGKILLDDKKLYVTGSVQTSGLAAIKIGMTGSPPSQEYQILNEGAITSWNINGVDIYKKIYVRYLPNGSFIGE